MESRRRIFNRMRAAYPRLRQLGSVSLAVGFLILCSVPSQAQDPQADTPLTLAPDIVTGQLDNGLTYFIRRNLRPERQVSLRLAVKAGSVDEADDQRGLAHLLEHMAFNGTEHFAPGELVSYMESIGARFGPHANAYTSFDETVYMLDVPTDRDGAVERSLEALADFAGGMTLDDQEIDRERGVVIEEWRGRQGASNRIQEQQLPAIFADSRYAERLPIGLPEVLESFPTERLRDFYREHYRPDRMAVIVVGALEPTDAEELIRDAFGGLPTRAPATRVRYAVPLHDETLVVSAADPELQGASLSLYFKQPRTEARTEGEYRDSLLRSLASGVLNDRFSELAERPDAPFLLASSGMQSIAGDLGAFGLFASVEADSLVTGISALGEEIARLQQHPIGANELARAQLDLLSAYERSYNERDTTESSRLANELVRHFIENEPVPGIEHEFALAERYVPAVTPAEITELARSLVTEAGRVILATAPGPIDVPPVATTELVAALRRGEASTVAAWDDGGIERALLETAPTPGGIVSRRELPELGVTVLTLANGVEVWLKPTDFKNDEIVFTAYSLGGTSLAGATGYQDASLSTALVDMAGVADLTSNDLRQLLAGRTARVNPYMSTYTHGVSGSTAPRDLELTLELLHVSFTAPNADPAAFDLLTRRLEASLANQADNPTAVFRDALRGLNTGNHYTARALRIDDLPGLSPDAMLQFYRDQFSNAADFTFFFAGVFDVAEIEPLLATYVGSLPSEGASTATYEPLDLVFPAGIEDVTVEKGLEEISQTVISFFSDTGLDEFEMHRLRAATTLLQFRLREVLREELGGTYSVGVGYSDNQPVPGYGTTIVQFGSAPDRASDLRAAVLTELNRLRAEGPTEEEIQRVQETEKRDLETAMRDNSYWMGSLQLVHLLGWDPASILRRIARAESLTTDNVRAALTRYVSPERYTVVTLMPEREGTSVP